MKKIVIENIKKNLLSQIVCKIVIENKSEEIHIEANQEYANYLVIDRIDAIVWGLLLFCINKGYNIESKIPITEDLWYNLEMNFIDILAQNPGMHRIKINAPLIPAMKQGNIVATGISCGIDSLYTIATHSDSVPKPYRITHLCFFDAGSHDTGLTDNSSFHLFKGRYDLCKAFAEEYNYGFIFIKNDIHEIIKNYGGYSHIENHTYMALSCIYALQPAFSKYYYSSGVSIRDFSCKKNNVNNQLDAAHYDLLTLSTASIPNIKFISTGGNVNRIQKTQIISNYAPAYKYLNVCVRSVENDSTCFKCIRTILTLDALGKIDKFKNVFNTEYYKIHKKEYIEKMYIEGKWKHDESLYILFPLFKSELTLDLKISALIHKFQTAFISKLFKQKKS